MSPAKTLIALLANHPELATLVSDLDALRKLDIEGIEILVPLIEVIRENPGYTLNHILGYWRGIHDIDQAEQLTEIAATDLLRPVANSDRDNSKEFQDILNRLLRHVTSSLPPLEFFHYLADKDVIDDYDLKNLNRAWLDLPSDQKNTETKALFNQIVAKPRSQ